MAPFPIYISVNRLLLLYLKAFIRNIQHLNYMSSKTGNQNKLTLQNLHQQLAKLKQPFLRQANQTAKQFEQKVREHGKRLIEHDDERQENTYRNEIENKPQIAKSSKRLKPERQKSGLQEKSGVKLTQTHWQEWKSNVEHGFKDYEQLVRNYDDVIYKKQKVKKMKNNEVIEDFRADERQMVLQIYQELKDKKNLTVSFKAIEEFFQNYDLFYYFYNIHPYRLKSLLRESAKNFPDKLTKQQFIDFFLIDRPNVAEFKAATEKKLSGNCILPQEIWKKLKNIFDTLDTFGNEKICIKTFFQRLKNNPSSLSLLSTQTIQFPQIRRVYTLEKVLFDLENKGQFQTKVDWTTISDSIQYFNHIEEPPLDIILRDKIQKAQITKDSNYFLLSSNVLQIIKDIFNHCPKNYGHFVKTSFLTYELLETGILKQFLGHATRIQNSTKSSYLTLQQVIKNLSKDAPQYIDMDEMLEFISIKGYQNFKKLINLYDEVQTESSEQEIQTQQRRKQRRLKKIKSLEQLKRNRRKDKKKPICQITKVKEFNLFKRESPTIRQQKVQEMIQQKKREDQIEMQKQFKANPIPVSLNTERYQKYVKFLQQKKQAILNRLGMKREQDQVIIDYLKSNTKLFEQKKTKRHCGQMQPVYNFEASPLPLHISQQLLPKIVAEKEERRKKLQQETRKKYKEVYWKKIRNSEFENDDDSLLEKINNLQEEKRKGKPFKHSEVPNFDELHRKFQEELQCRRQKFQPTQIQQFNLSSPKQAKLKQSMSPQPYHFKSKSPPKTNEGADVKSTKKYDDWVAFNQARMAEKQLTQLQKQKQAEQRHMKQKNFAKFMRKYLGNCTDNTELLRHKSEEKLKNFKQHVKKLEEQTSDELAQIYARVLQRPFLFEEAAGKTRKPKSKQKPKKIQIENNMPQQHQQGYDPYKDGLFEKEGSQYHPVESENLNQSF